MSENIEPTQDEIEETPEVEAHSAEVLGLQGVSVPGGQAENLIAVSCSSCLGSVC